MNSLWKRLKKIVFHHILHADDTPHRLALGVALGFLICCTPTIGLQIVIYIGLAALLGANKVSGIPFLFISNPFTAVPLYYFMWKVGEYTINLGPGGHRGVSTQEIKSWLGETTHTIRESGGESFLDPEFWQDVGRLLISTGTELWLGAFVFGIPLAVMSYFLTRWGVTAFREAREHRRLSRVPPPPTPVDQT
jgi:uncharacterized protein (DUF2062 family)